VPPTGGRVPDVPFAAAKKRPTRPPARLPVLGAEIAEPGCSPVAARAGDEHLRVPGPTV